MILICWKYCCNMVLLRGFIMVFWKVCYWSLSIFLMLVLLVLIWFGLKWMMVKMALVKDVLILKWLVFIFCLKVGRYGYWYWIVMVYVCMCWICRMVGWKFLMLVNNDWCILRVLSLVLNLLWLCCVMIMKFGWLIFYWIVWVLLMLVVLCFMWNICYKWVMNFRILCLWVRMVSVYLL